MRIGKEKCGGHWDHRIGFKMGKDVMVACNFDSREKLFSFLDMFGEESIYVKVGMDLYYAEGPDIIREIKRRGHKIFLDLKLYDIPAVVKKTMTVLSKLDVDMVNVHAAGTIEMMKAAVEGLTQNDGTRPRILAVTQLTSTSEERMNRDQLIDTTMEQVVLHYAKNAKEAGLDGVVCSAQEARRIHKECGDDFLTVTPGIRFEENDVADQVRVMTPKQAKEEGVHYIVVGRPITETDNSVAAYHRCVTDFVG